MSSPDVAARPEAYPTDTPVLVAAIGSSLLALPGIVGAAGLVVLVFWIAGDTRSGSDLETASLALVLAGLLTAIAGLSFLSGYWKAARGGAHSRRFWRLSAGYNAVCIVLTGAAALEGILNQTLLMVAPLVVAWMVYMVWLGLTRAAASTAEAVA